jgi:hypothetical protein
MHRRRIDRDVKQKLKQKILDKQVTNNYNYYEKRITKTLLSVYFMECERRD